MCGCIWYLPILSADDCFSHLKEGIPEKTRPFKCTLYFEHYRCFTSLSDNPFLWDYTPLTMQHPYSYAQEQLCLLRTVLCHGSSVWVGLSAAVWRECKAPNFSKCSVHSGICTSYNPTPEDPNYHLLTCRCKLNRSMMTVGFTWYINTDPSINSNLHYTCTLLLFLIC